MLNEYNEETKGIIHLLVTSLCNRNCKFCCNKQYDLNSIPYVTDEELKNCHTLCLTGGEPFAYANPGMIARFYKRKYPNIKKVYVYTNAFELGMYLSKYDDLSDIDGVDVSIKTKFDLETFNSFLVNNKWFTHWHVYENRVYIFDNLVPKDFGTFKSFERKWQEDFEPAQDSIFRKI